MKVYVAGVNVVTRTYGYNAKGQVSSEGSWVTGVGATRTLLYGYDVMGRRNTVTYPDGETVTTYFNAMGLPVRLVSTTSGVNTVLVQGTIATPNGNGAAYDAFGRLTQMSMHGATTWRTVSYYAPTGQGYNSGALKSIQVGTTAGGKDLLGLDYEWDSVGNVKTITDTVGTPLSHTNVYDHQSRVLTGLGKAFTWENDGRHKNFEGKTVIYPTNKQGMTAIDGGGVFVYDLNGNMTSRKTKTAAAQQTLTWTKDNRLEKVVVAGGLTETYYYDHTGQRVRTNISGADRHFFLFPEMEVKIAGGVTSEIEYYFFGGQRVAMRVNNGAFVYLHSDHLGSTVTTTSGTAGTQERYQAYGATRSTTSITATDVKYTGQFSDTVTGLIYMNARYYDPTIGQFISPDTIVPDPNNLFDYNRYLYVRGNPLKYSDPSGHDPLDSSWEREFFVNHGYYPSDFDRRDRLFSLMFFGSGAGGSWTKQDWELYGIQQSGRDSGRIDQLWNGGDDWPGAGSAGLERFASHVDRLSNWYGPREGGEFVKAFAFVFGNVPLRNPMISMIDMINVADNMLIPYLHEGDSGWNPMLNDDGQPAHHYAGLLYAGYWLGAPAAIAINHARDGRFSGYNAPDLMLGDLASVHGQWIASGLVGFRQLGNLIRTSLGPK